MWEDSGLEEESEEEAQEPQEVPEAEESAEEEISGKGLPQSYCRLQFISVLSHGKALKAVVATRKGFTATLLYEEPPCESSRNPMVHSARLFLAHLIVVQR